jgi:hypothetical protein
VVIREFPQAPGVSASGECQRLYKTSRDDGKTREGRKARSLTPEKERGTADFGSAPFCTSGSTDIDLAPLSKAEFLRYKLPKPMVLALLWSTVSFRFCGTELILRLVSSLETLS